MSATGKSPSRKQTTAPFRWEPGQVFERPVFLFSDASVSINRESRTLEELRAELPEENRNETGPAHMTRVGRVRVEVLAVEDPVPALPSTDVVDLLQRVRALPRLTPSLKAEIDIVLSGAARG